MQRTDTGLFLDFKDIGELVAKLRLAAKSTYQTDPDVQKVMLQAIDQLERGVGTFEPGIDLDVHGGRTFLRHAIPVKTKQDLVTMIGELDGIKVYCRERGGRVKVIMTKEDLYE